MKPVIKTMLRLSKWQDALAVGFLFILILIFLGRALLPGKVLMPLDIVLQLWSPWQQPNQPVSIQNEILSDVVNYVYPIKEFMADSIRNGQLPLWNPYEFTGYPFTYNTQAGMFYPFSLLYYILPMATAFDLVIILQMCLGVLFMFIYLRRLQLNRLAAMVGTIVFIFNGLMVGWLEWQVIHAAIIWLPAQLFIIERMADKLSTQSNPKRLLPLLVEVISFGFLFAIPWLGGHWHWTLYGSLTVVIYMVFRLEIIRYGWNLIKRNRPSQIVNEINNFRVAVTAMFISLGTGVALSFIQVLPAFIYLNQSHRKAVSISDTFTEGLYNRAIVFLMPNFFGNNADIEWWGPAGNIAETLVYSGILALFLGCLAIFMRRDFYTRFFSAWGGLTLLWALGSPAYFLLYFLPVFNGTQPSRASFLFLFCLAVLAALAVDKLMQKRADRPEFLTRLILAIAVLFLIICLVYFAIFRTDVIRTWDYLKSNLIHFALFFIGAVALLVLRIKAWIKPYLFGWMVLVWIVLDLFLFGYNYNVVSDVADIYPDTEVSGFLQDDPEIFRIVTPARGIVFFPNTSLVERIQNLSGYEPGVLERISNLMKLAEGQSAVRFGRLIMPLEAIDSPILDILNVKYVTTTHDYWTDVSVVDVVQDRIDQWVELPLEQPFVMEHAGLHRLDIPLQVQESATGTVTVRILSENGLYEFARAEVDIEALGNEEWQSFFFNAFPSTWGRSFLFRIESLGSEGGVKAGANNSNEAAYAAYYLPRPDLAFEQGTTRIYLNEGYFPRAYFVPEAQILANEEMVLNAIAQNMDRLDEIVFLELEGKNQPPLIDSANMGAQEVQIQSYGLNKIELFVKLENPGYLVLSDTYYPGWEATIDGEKVPVYRANSILRAVYVPAGNHQIVFYFWPKDFLVGAMFSLGALILSLVGLIIVLIRAKRISINKHLTDSVKG